MTNPNAQQVAAAQAIIKTFAIRYGATASDTMLAAAAHSVYAVMSGENQPAAEYRDVIAQATGGDLTVKESVKSLGDGSYEILGENVLGLPVGVYTREGAEEENYDEAALRRLTKAEIAEQAQAEGFELSEGTKESMIAQLLMLREGPLD